MKPIDWYYRAPIIVVFILVAFLGLLVSFGRSSESFLPPVASVSSEIDSPYPVRTAKVILPFAYPFRGTGILQEKNQSNKSGNPYWWLNSGAELIFSGNFASTIEGSLPTYSRWRIAYAKTNSLDTDGGYYPQNLFRLVSRQKWLDYRQTLYFQILRDNLSGSPNRNDSNGIFLFNRYQDGDNLYYTGVRVDGTAVIKKKQDGEYTTLVQTPIWTSDRPYDRKNNTDILPKGQWVGLESRVVSLPGGKVSIELWLDKGGKDQWEKVLSTVDDGLSFGPTINRSGYTGIRTDFMDVLFWRYKIDNI